MKPMQNANPNSKPIGDMHLASQTNTDRERERERERENLFKRYAACEQFDHVPCSDDDVRVIRLSSCTHSHTT